MTFTRKQFDQSADAARLEAVKKRAPQLKVAVHAALEAEQLTSDPVWNKYLEILQARIEYVEHQKQNFLKDLTDATIVNVDAIMTAKLGYLECNSFIKAWEEAMAILGEIVDSGKSAKEILGEQGS